MDARLSPQPSSGSQTLDVWPVELEGRRAGPQAAFGTRGAAGDNGGAASRNPGHDCSLSGRP
jgi:hypothetical protein